MNPVDARIDVMIPFVRGTDHLIDAIESVRAQTDSRWRLTVIDNAGPEPEAQERVDQLADPRVEYRRFDDHVPMADNWNRAIAEASTDWVVLLHADDEWEPTMVAELHRMVAANPLAAACFTGGHTIDAVGAPMFSLPDRYKRFLLGGPGEDLVLTGDVGTARLLRGNFVFASAICLNRSIVGNAPYDTSLRFAPDYELVLRLLLEGNRLVASRTDACRYRRHPGQATVALTRASQRFDEEIHVYRSARAQALVLGWRRSARTARRRASLRINLALHALSAVRTDRGTAAALLRSAIELS